ncbi:hypothetical protein [Salinibaculum rarum]|uniref:hypothetical protein n=1 Tax=Salinibaculum rarum TaxID=3058903 RepID=UPI00265F9EE1|nr:hypothetical protein [Salinibaculum sp. KK48]
MTILIRNVTGADVLTIRKTVSDDGPINRDALINAYFPGDGSNPQTSDQRKPLEDAIEFLIETDQIHETSDGYELTSTAAAFDDSRLSLLSGIRSADGEDAAYNEVLEYLAEQTETLADSGGELLDEMSDRVPNANWNKQKLRYWSRVMAELGVLKEINGEKSNLLIGPSRDLTLRMLTDVAGEGTASTASVVTDIDERYLPVLGEGRDVAPYFEQTLLSLQETNDVLLQTVSDIGQSVDIGGTSYSAIEVMTNE